MLLSRKGPPKKSGHRCPVCESDQFNGLRCSECDYQVKGFLTEEEVKKVNRALGFGGRSGKDDNDKDDNNRD